MNTSNFVLDETFTLLSRWAGIEFAVQAAHSMYASKILHILRPDLEDEIKAVYLLKKYTDQKVSFTNGISFVLMEKQKIRNAFTFDRHFERAGFRTVP